MQIIHPKSEDYKKTSLLKNEIIRGVSTAFPTEDFFVNAEMKLIFWGWGAVFGDLNGEFHHSIRTFLKKNEQSHYYIIPLDINMEMYDNNLPILKFFTFDKNETYSAAFGLDFCFESGFTNYTLAQIPDGFLFCNEIKNWLFYYNRYSDIGIFGYTDKLGREFFVENFQDYILNKERVQMELEFVYPPEVVEKFKETFFSKILM